MNFQWVESIKVITMLTFKEDTHEYFWNGKKVPSVSEILHKTGCSNYEGMQEEQLKAYADFGNFIHEATELYDNGELEESCLDEMYHPFKVDEGITARHYFERWLWFLKEFDVQVLATEHMIFNEQMWFAGTIDRIAIVKGEMAIVEIKTGMAKKTHRLQTAAYMLGYGNIIPRYHVYLRPDIDEKKSVQVWDGEFQDIDINAFKAALHLQTWKTQRTKKSNNRAPLGTWPANGYSVK